MGTTSSDRSRAEQPRIERKDRRERTRERFINAALELLRTDGVQGVTVSQVSKRIEVHHTLFYAHFEDVSACLAAAADRVLATLAPVDRELRRELMGRAVTDRRALARYFEGAFERWMNERACVELLLAHRLDRSALGEALRPALAAMRDDLATELWDLAAQVGIAGRYLPEVRAHADLLVGHWLWALEMLIEGRAQDRTVLAGMLADVMISTNLRFLDHARRPSREQAIASAYSSEQRQKMCAARARLNETLLAHDDAWIIEHSGSAETMLRRVLEATCAFFLPAVAGPARARVRYRVAAPDRAEPIELDLVMENGTCRLEDASGAPTLVLAMSFRTALETITRARHFDQAFRAGDLRIAEGDLNAALSFLDWFDYYE
jgi:AcrR family transcriptional regulator